MCQFVVGIRIQVGYLPLHLLSRGIDEEPLVRRSIDLRWSIVEHVDNDSIRNRVLIDIPDGHYCSMDPIDKSINIDRDILEVP